MKVLKEVKSGVRSLFGMRKVFFSGFTLSKFAALLPRDPPVPICQFVKSALECCTPHPSRTHQPSLPPLFFPSPSSHPLFLSHRITLYKMEAAVSEYQKLQTCTSSPFFPLHPYHFPYFIDRTHADRRFRWRGWYSFSKRRRGAPTVGLSTAGE